MAAAKGISQVIISRIVMCAPGMGNFIKSYILEININNFTLLFLILFIVLLPIIMEKLENKSLWFKRNTWIHAPFQTVAVGCL